MPGRDRDHVEELGRLVQEHRVRLLAGQGRHAAPDVAGQRLDLLQRHRVDLLVPGRPGQGLQVKLAVAGHDGQADAVLVATGHQRLEDLLGGHPDLAGDRLGGQVVGIDLVLPKLVADAQAIEESDGVGLGDLHEPAPNSPDRPQHAAIDPQGRPGDG